MKNTLHMFTDLNTGLKIPFALDKFTAAKPIGPNESLGTELFGVGIPGGITIKETLPVVNEVVSQWFQTAGSVARN